jgi:ABC-2 type transport system ATP-binding protein
MKLIRTPPRGSAGCPMCARAIATTMLAMTSTLPSPAIETRGLGKTFGSRAALERIDLVVPRGVAFGFLGANGAGKTTLIRLLLGLAQPTAGSMRVLGHDLPGGRAAALARVGAIIEEPRFHPHLTGRENLRVHAAARDAAARGRIDASLARVGLLSRADDKVKTYSLGMRQRLGVARCLLGDPELLILDEPLNGLDPAGILEMRRLIREFVEEGRTVLLSSHLLDEVEKTCDVAAIVDQGKVVAQGTIHELVNGGTRAIDVVCHGPAEVVALLAAVPGVTRAADHEGAIRVTLAPEAPVDREIVTALLRRLLDHGVDVERIAPAATSLEDRFLTMTTRLEDRS